MFFPSVFFLGDAPKRRNPRTYPLAPLLHPIQLRAPLQAPPNAAGNAERFAFAISYFADGARVVDEIGLQHINDEDSPSYEDWLSDIYPGEIIDHALLPVVFGPKDAASS